MQRVVLLGKAGSGKSTLATKLAQIIGLPVVHLDAFLAAGCRVQWPKLSFVRWICRFPVDELPPMFWHLDEFAAPQFAVTRLFASQVAPFLAQVAAGAGSSATPAKRETI